MKNLRKLMALLLALVMCLSLASFALADEEAEDAEIPELNWEDVAEEVEASIPGEFVVFDEIYAAMYVPDIMLPQELTEEDVEAGYIAYFATEEEDAAIAVMYVDGEGMDLEAYFDFLAEEDGITDLEVVIINGIVYVSYVIPETDCMCLATDTEMGYILEFTFSPYSDEDYSQLAALVAMSIQPVEEEDVEAA